MFLQCGYCSEVGDFLTEEEEVGLFWEWGKRKCTGVESHEREIEIERF